MVDRFSQAIEARSDRVDCPKLQLGLLCYCGISMVGHDLIVLDHDLIVKNIGL